MNLTPKALAPLALAAALVPGAARADLITFTVSGSIKFGQDRIGLFVEPEGSLAGLPYTLSLTTDTTHLLQTRTDYGNRLSYNNHAVHITGYATVAGKTYSWDVPHGRGVEVALHQMNSLTMGGSGSNPADGWAVGTFNHVAIDAPWGTWVHDVEFDHDMQFVDYPDGGSSRSEFRVQIPMNPPPGAPRDWAMATSFHGDATRLQWSVSPVPEPGQYLMLLAGVGVLARLRRRARRTACAG